MKNLIVAACFAATAALAQTPSNLPANLVVEGVPAFPEALVRSVHPYLEFRTATFQDWQPTTGGMTGGMIVTTRFGDTPQVHLVKAPGGARRQLTFLDERVSRARFRPDDPNTIVYASDTGGAEFFQLYRYDLVSGKTALLTDGKSRNTGSTFSRDGKWLAYSSTRRNGKDTDIWIEDPMHPESARMLMQCDGGGWSATDFSPDGAKLLVHDSISVNEGYVYLLDVNSGAKTLLTPKTAEPAANSGAMFAPEGGAIYFVSDEGSQFEHLVKLHLADNSRLTLSREEWSVEEFDVSSDGKRIAYITNEDGVSRIHIRDTSSGEVIALPTLPLGVISNIKWQPSRPILGFTVASAKSPSDAYSVDVDNGRVARWTESETGGLDPSLNVDPQLVTMKSFDGLQISALIYRPDPARFPGKRPVLMNIHGGPEGQARPGFLGRINYWLNELGIAVIYPNVRGSTGYGKTFVALDNGMKREDAVKDIGTVINWINSDPGLDAGRIGVYGGSYGGYMALATMTHYNERMKAAIDVVGVSNFVTLLTTTSDYRRDLRRVEYGDETDPKMRAFLQQISPLTNASKITKPLFVIAGFNDPRVPYTEGQQIVKAVRANGAPVWWLMAKDEGHGFAKKKNVDYQFLAMTMFLKQSL
jgi:dipeptidyl aminopeptidase/acylaminoacyl peptidase